VISGFPKVVVVAVSRMERVVGTVVRSLDCVERRRELLCGVEASVEPADELRLVLRTGEGCDGPVLDGNQWLLWVGERELAAGTRDSAGRPVLDERGRSVRCEPAGGSEPFEMGLTPHDRDRQLIEKQEGYRLTGGRLEGSLAGITLDRWGTLGLRMLLLGDVCRTHVRVIHHWVVRRERLWASDR
jgi:hypothetical protein